MQKFTFTHTHQTKNQDKHQTHLLSLKHTGTISSKQSHLKCHQTGNYKRDLIKLCSIARHENDEKGKIYSPIASHSWMCCDSPPMNETLLDVAIKDF